MKRAISVLTVVLVAAFVALAVSRHVFANRSSMDWLRDEFHLTDAQMEKAAALHSEYEASCETMCRRIAETDARLASAIRSSTSITPEIAAAIAETDRVRTDCRIAMLSHFYQTAALMPESERQRYLDKVLPVVLHPGEMHDDHMR
ncbi:periplasmic heavy metal sensor [Terrimicrobium sacchariphilum]|nr:periplasmic heavy metal sensor [Terrimicrobium sacchariphilum]